MAVGGIGNRGEASKVIEEAGADGSKKRQGAEGALLQTAAGIERIEQDALVTVENTGTKVFGAGDLSLELFDLMENLALGGMQGFEERGIEAAEWFLVGLQHGPERCFAFLEAGGERGGK